MPRQSTPHMHLLLALTLSLLVFALIAAPASAMENTHSPSTTANLPAAAQQTLTAMASLRSYEMSMDITTLGQPASQSPIHVDAIVVRHGTTVEWDVKMTTSLGPGRSYTMESVIVGARTCFRMTGILSWRCGAVPSSLSSITTYTNVANTFGGRVQMTPSGHTVMHGIGCNGYHMTIAVTTTPGLTVTSQGTIWLDAATHWIVEEDLMTSTPNWTSSATHPVPSITHMAKVVYSHYNDPSLAIPALPAA